MSISIEELREKYPSKEAIEARLKEIKKIKWNKKKEIDFNNAMNLSKKLIINGSYGAVTTNYFVMFNEHVGASITAHGRELTRKMDEASRHYWYNLWHNDIEAHRAMNIEGRVSQITESIPTTVYGDSITGDSLITTEAGTYSIEHLYNQYRDSIGEDKEVIRVNFSSLNYTNDKGVHFSKVKNIIAHKVSKPKWELKAGGKSIVCTADHSLVVFRNGEQLTVKPNEIVLTDRVLISLNSFDHRTVNITSIECIGDFNDTIVYDLEMEDSSHTFIANDILVHNTDSLMVSFQPCINSIKDFDFPEREFILELAHKVIEPYFLKCLEDHAASYGVVNTQEFELERVNESMINIAKKKYIQNVVYEDGGKFEPLSYIASKGVEIVRSSTPVFVRERIMEPVKYLLGNSKTFNIQELIGIIKDIRKEFEIADINDIARQSSVNDYQTLITNDKDKLEFRSGTPAQVKAAAFHNYLLNQRPDLHTKYNFIKSGNKVKLICCKNEHNDLFAFVRGSYPNEFNIEIDYETQFAKTFLSPINSIIEPLGLPEINKRLSVVMDIFGGFGGETW